MKSLYTLRRRRRRNEVKSIVSTGCYPVDTINSASCWGVVYHLLNGEILYKPFYSQQYLYMFRCLVPVIFYRNRNGSKIFLASLLWAFEPKTGVKEHSMKSYTIFINLFIQCYITPSSFVSVIF